MKTKLASALTAAAMILIAAPASADSLVHMWHCQLNDDQTVAELEAVSADWLKAARGMKGGEEIEVYLEFPIAADAGDGQFSFVMIIADAKTWGIFMNDYDGSPAAEADEAWSEVAACSGSSVWASVEIE